MAVENRRYSSWPTDGRPPGYFSLPLDAKANQFYHENGFLVVEDCFTMDEVEGLRSEALAICKGERGPIKGLEPTGPGESAADVLKRTLCIHFPYKVSDSMLQQVRHPSLIETLKAVIGPNVKCMQSMLFIKAAGKPGQAWHQDEDYIPTRDRSLTGCWLALDDATVDNGCLWVIPGSHRAGVLWPMKYHNDQKFDCSWESFDFPYTDDMAVPVEVKAGSLVVFNGYLLHRSLPNNQQTGYRRALVNHYMSTSSLLPWLWPEKPTGMALHDHRDVILVCGTDPYAWKGTEDIMEAHLRPDGQGGCFTGEEDD